MGIVGATCFCKNGHIIDSYSDDEWYEGPLEECFCGSKEYSWQTAWRDDDYDQYIPAHSIGKDFMIHNIPLYRKKGKELLPVKEIFYIEVNRYDVSKVNDWQINRKTIRRYYG